MANNRRKSGGIEAEVRRRERLRARPSSSKPLAPSLWLVTADYTSLADGSWVAQVRPRRQPATEARGADMHETFHRVLDVVDALSDETETPVSTMHTLDGDLYAWSKLAREQGFASCVTGEDSPHMVLDMTPDGELSVPAGNDADASGVGQAGR